MTINREKVTAQAVADLRSRLADAAISWCRHSTMEATLDERPPARQSNVAYRRAAAADLQEIRRLTEKLDGVQNQS